MGAGSGPAHGSRVIHNGADELLIYRHSVPDGEIILPIQEETQYAHPLSSFLSNLVFSKITSSFDPLVGTPKSVTGRGWMKRRPARATIIAVPLGILLAILHSLNHR
jgi:hypothetical protein